ncbi:MAG: DsrH/TusB family sulfur relay protein [Candidatus Hydrothermarchaeales archaeon]
MVLYLLDLPYGKNGLNLAIQGAKGGDSKVVLIQNGIYLGGLDAAKDAGVEIYAVKQDVEDRGLKLPDYVKLVDYSDLVDLVLKNKVANFA